MAFASSPLRWQRVAHTTRFCVTAGALCDQHETSKDVHFQIYCQHCEIDGATRTISGEERGNLPLV